MNTSLEIALPAVITQKVQPKPTRSEIIQALAHRKMAHIQKEKASIDEKIAAAEKKVNAMLIAYALKVARQCECDTYHGYNHSGGRSGASVRFKLDNLPESIVAALAAYDTLKSTQVRVPDFKKVRDEIRDSLLASQPDRVAAMVSSPAMAKALDKMLVELEAKPDAVPCAVVGS
jgi:hypothetical protein